MISEKYFDKSVNRVKLGGIWSNLYLRKESLLCGLKDSEFARYLIVRKVALASPSHDRGGRFLKSLVSQHGHGAFFSRRFCYDFPS